MSGRRRTFLAQNLAAAMNLALQLDGPQPIERLLERHNYDAAVIEQMPEWRRDAVRMAIRGLIMDLGASLDLDGRLCPAAEPQPTPVRAARDHTADRNGGSDSGW